MHVTDVRPVLVNARKLLDKRLFAFLAPRRREHHDQCRCRHRQHGRADRTRDEDHRVATQEKQRAPQIPFPHRLEYESKQQRRGLGIELGANVAEQANQQHKQDIEVAVVQAKHADGGENQDSRIGSTIQTFFRGERAVDARKVRLNSCWLV